MATINLPTLELTSTIREAPLNGAPSSQDYNDSWSECLTDLVTLASFINDQLITMLNSLPAAAAEGIDGTTIYSDPSSQASLFFNQATSTPLSIADSLNLLLAMINSILTQLTALTVQVTSLQTTVAGSSANTVIVALTNMQTQINEIIAKYPI